MRVEKKMSLPRVAQSLAVAFIAIVVSLSCAVSRGQSSAPALVRGTVDDAARVTLTGNVHPLARPEFDLGRVEDSFAADRLYVILKRSPQQENALTQFMQDAHTPGTAEFHQWLTPEQFGQKFGAADSDIAAFTAWLQSHGFTVNKVHPGRNAIEFSGNAAQIRAAFRTEIHRYKIIKDGVPEIHFANSTDPQIPAAFASLVAGISPMHSFHGQPMIKVAGKTSYNAKTHVAKPEWTYPEPCCNPNYVDELGPGDFAVQYDVNPVYKAGTNGAGVSIGILSASNVDLSLVQAYQKLFKLPANLPTVVIDGNDPGENGAATEAYLDVEQSGAVAPGAKVYLYASNGTIVTDPLLTSGWRALEDNQVSVISMSYGNCESALGAGGNAAWNTLWQQAAAQGITGFVSAGDGGSAGCDDFDTEGDAKYGLAVNGFGSTPYNVSVGGTDFYYSDYAQNFNNVKAQIATYWSPNSTNTPAVSLSKPVPEQVWNGAFGLNALDGGSYQYLLDYYGSNIIAGSGGVSSAALYPTSGPTGYPKPLWQSGTGVPNDKVRDLPDLSLYASNGFNFAYYPICAYPGDCTETGSDGAVYITSVGGTSASSPAMAGIQALVDQATKSRQGQADWVYYALATKTATSATKPFRDITEGGNEVPCTAATPNCVYTTTGQANGFYAESGYYTTVGYDLATGLGTVDVANLIKDWSLLTFKPSTTTLSITPATIAHGTTMTAKVTVAPKSGSGTPTGSAGLFSNDAVGDAKALDVFSLTGGAVSGSLDNLPGGTYQVAALYSGDGTFGPSTSNGVTVTVSPEKDTLNAKSWIAYPLDDNLYSLTPGMAIPYGSILFHDVVPVGVNEASSTLGDNAPATGAITFKDTVGTASQTASVPLSSVGRAEWQNPALTPGNHVLSAYYNGDNSYTASTNPSAATFSVFKGTTSIYIKPVEPGQQVGNNVSPRFYAGGNVTVDVVMYSGYFGLEGALPTGTLSITLGGQTQTVLSPFKVWGQQSNPTAEAVVTFTNIPAGLLPLSATYSGDANWLPTTSFWGTVNSLSTANIPTVTLTAAAATLTPSGTVTLTGTVTGKNGGPAPVGFLYFTWEDGDYYYYYTMHPKAGTTNASTVTLTFPASELAPGPNLFVATFEGDTTYGWQSSTPVAVTLNGGDFTLVTNTQTVSVKPGASAVGSVTVAPVSFYTGAVTLTCAAPTGITCTPSVAAPIVGAGNTDPITIKAASTVKQGFYPAVVTATGQGRVHTLQILVAVQ